MPNEIRIKLINSAANSCDPNLAYNINTELDLNHFSENAKIKSVK